MELKTRIPVVTNWVPVGTARLQEAQTATGLSNERLARQIPVSSKTWERWKAKGAIPASSLPAVAKALRLELVDPDEQRRLELVRGVTTDDRLAALADAVDEVLAGQRELRTLLRKLAAPPAKQRNSSQASPRRKAR